MSITSKASLQGFTSSQSLPNKERLTLKEVHSFFSFSGHYKMKFSNVLLNNTSKHYVVRFVKLTASKIVPKCALCTHKYKPQMYKYK